MMMCSDCGGIIVFQGCNSMQKNSKTLEMWAQGCRFL